MEKYFDPRNSRLVFIKNNANALFWNSHWNRLDIKNQIKAAVFNRLILGPTKKYLPRGSRILEGGCGLGQNVYSLQKGGYEVYGVDYANETVMRVNKAIPQLNVSFGDVRQLPFKESFFEGYWSLGVIEHFYSGFYDIVLEMRRVTKPSGYIFLTFPCMSFFRLKKAGQGKYKQWREETALIKNFYQFALSMENVVSIFEEMKFELIKSQSLSGLKGFKDETEYKPLRDLLQNIYDSTRFSSRGIAWILDQVLAPYAGHTRLLIFRNRKNTSPDVKKNDP